MSCEDCDCGCPDSSDNYGGGDLNVGAPRSVEQLEADTDWLERRGSLPSDLDEVELA